MTEGKLVLETKDNVQVVPFLLAPQLINDDNLEVSFAISFAVKSEESKIAAFTSKLILIPQS